MYITTFYSFKGGVGRTQALINVGAELAQRGRRVLLVDFDLEAPGIPTFHLPMSHTRRGGLVDYVSDYVRTAESPDVTDYITPFLSVGTQGGGLWIMPSGAQDPRYSQRLNAIDWARLYAEQDGYFLFEDLKLQWSVSLRPDYVLIDSRTGHTDVGGICTRQLPDSVVVFFLPNDQNLSGLTNIVRDIRHESESRRKKKIHLDFVVSNVPDIDDEDGILQARLERFKAILGYESPATTIHHYDSLALLDQVVFTMERPRTRLARQYCVLADKLIENNLIDRDGAIAFLESYSRRFRAMSSERRAAAEDRLDEVGTLHAQDAAILQHLGRIRIREGKFVEAVGLFDQAVHVGGPSAEALLGRAEARFVLGEKDAAAADLRAMLDMGDATDVDVTRAVNWLREIDKNAIRKLAGTRAVVALAPESQISLAGELQADREGQFAAVELLQRTLAAPLTPTLRHTALNTFGLCLIGIGRFSDAIEALRLTVDFENSVVGLFNFAMAKWGEAGAPDYDLFRRVTRKQSMESDIGGPNYSECLALVYAVLGEREEATRHLGEARNRIRSAEQRIFSCWRYLVVPAAEFLADLESIERLNAGVPAMPGFIATQRLLLPK